MASLPSTELVLQHLRRSCTAEKNLLAGAQPAKVDRTVLPDLSSHPPLPGFHWTSLDCDSIGLSACGCYMAVVLEGQQQRGLPHAVQPGRHGQAKQARPQPEVADMYQVILYSIAGEMRELEHFYLSDSQPVLQWSRTAPLLSVFQSPHEQEGVIACTAELTGEVHCFSMTVAVCCIAWGGSRLSFCVSKRLGRACQLSGRPCTAIFYLCTASTVPLPCLTRSPAAKTVHHQVAELRQK